MSPTLPSFTGVPAGPTVAETGAPKAGTGGPSSGQLASRPPPTANFTPVSLASFGTSSEAAAERATAEASIARGSLEADDARTDIASIGGSEDELSSREQAIRWKEAEAAKYRIAASGSGESSTGINRMATTSRRRLEASEAEWGEDEALPAYHDGVGEDDESTRRA